MRQVRLLSEFAWTRRELLRQPSGTEESTSEPAEEDLLFCSLNSPHQRSKPLVLWELL
jgi:hypothetical protein